MSKEIRRVPLDFDWPLKKVWKGFLPPEVRPCPREGETCFGGYTAHYLWLEGVVQMLTMAAREAKEASHPRNPRRIYPHPSLQECEFSPRKRVPTSVIKECQLLSPADRLEHLNAWHRLNPSRLLPLTQGLVDLVEGLAGREILPIGGDGTDWKVMGAITAAAGIDIEQWMCCPVCGGEAQDPADATGRDWEPTPPPEGPGWQVWESVSEGSPVSPVFATQEELVEHLVEQGYSRDAAQNFCESGWAPSAAFRDGKMLKDIEICGGNDSSK